MGRSFKVTCLYRSSSTIILVYWGWSISKLNIYCGFIFGRLWIKVKFQTKIYLWGFPFTSYKGAVVAYVTLGRSHGFIIIIWLFPFFFKTKLEFPCLENIYRVATTFLTTSDFICQNIEGTLKITERISRPRENM